MAVYEPNVVRKRATEYTVYYYDGTVVKTFIRPSLSKMYVERVTTRAVTLEASMDAFVKIAHEAQEEK
jgi:hypothetical protein